MFKHFPIIILQMQKNAIKQKENPHKKKSKKPNRTENMDI